MLTSQRNKSSRTRKGCILCYNIGAAAPAFAYVRVSFPKNPWTKTLVEKELPLCFKHSTRRTESRPAGILDGEYGEWNKTPFGYIAIREEVYELANGDVTLLTGSCGKIPLWW